VSRNGGLEPGAPFQAAIRVDAVNKLPKEIMKDVIDTRT
jgi:hypothetical protein